MRTSVVLAFICLTAVAALPKKQQRIVGGSDTTIETYPYGAALLYASDFMHYTQSCGGAIINNRAILSSAQCIYGYVARNWRIRVGSSLANSGGTVHNTNQLITHSSYDADTLENDIGILHTTSAISYNAAVRSASIAGPNYSVADGEIVWAIGWGATSYGGSSSEQLQDVQIWSVNQEVCSTSYAELGVTITDSMLCAGYVDVGGRNQCQGDTGGPLFHNTVVVGIYSFGEQCGLAEYPGVNTRVSSYTAWIQANA